MVRRGPRIAPSDIKRQTHGLAEGPFVIFEDLRARKMSHHFVIRRSGRALFAHHTLRSNTFTHACWSHRRAHSKMQTSATVVLMKSTYEGGVDESLAPKVRELLPARSAQMPEERTAVF